MSRPKRQRAKQAPPPSVLIAVRRLLRDNGRLTPAELTQGLVALGWGSFDLDAVEHRLRGNPREFMRVRGRWAMHPRTIPWTPPQRVPAARRTAPEAGNGNPNLRRIPRARSAEPERVYAALKPAPRSALDRGEVKPGACRACDLVPDFFGRCACS